MSVPLSQMLTVIRYVVGKRLRRQRHYPLVLMLEPLFRCNLACSGCGKIQHPTDVLRQQLTPQQCFEAVKQCGAPIVSIPGGEPLLHPQIDQIVAGLVERRKYIYLCTNGIKLRESLDQFRPSRYLAFSVHLDGRRRVHDQAVCRDGVYDAAIDAISAARDRGFRVTTNTTLFDGTDPREMRAHFDDLMRLGVEGMMISPGYRYEKAPDQDHFLAREQTRTLFRQILDRPDPRWRFNQTPLFLEFLKGNWQLDCTPWGNPTYNVLGWQRPCYLLDEGYCETYAQWLQATDWAAYGHASGNPKCRDCMVHCGFEPSAVAATFGSLAGLTATARITIKQTFASVVGRRRGEMDDERTQATADGGDLAAGPDSASGCDLKGDSECQESPPASESFSPTSLVQIHLPHPAPGRSPSLRTPPRAEDAAATVQSNREAAGPTGLKP